MNEKNPDIEWYTELSKNKQVQSRCPFASVEACPRYYQSLSLLGEAGSTSIESNEDKRLEAYWNQSDLWPKTGEYATSVSGVEGNIKNFMNYCPEIIYDRFGYFASFIAGYSDALDRDVAQQRLIKCNASPNDWQWSWNFLTPTHYTECQLYSLLDHRSKTNRFPFSGGISEKSEDSIKNIESKHPKYFSGKDRWKKLPKKLKIILLSIISLVTISATFLTNIEKIEHFYKTKISPPTVPKITVKLTNSGEDGVIVSARGDFLLWLPGPGALHKKGKYEFILSDGNSPEGGKFVVPPKDTVTVFAEIMNEIYFSKILDRSDCDLSLIVYISDAGLTNTNDIPFTKEAFKNFFIEADVGK